MNETTSQSEPSPPAPEAEPKLRRMTRRGFAVAGGAAGAAFLGWKWIESRGEDGGLAWPLRRVLEANETIARRTLGTARLAPEFPRSASAMPRVNGVVGLDPDLDIAAWRLRVVGPAGVRHLAMADLRGLPRVAMTTELKCVEGWSRVVSWAGVRLVDLAVRLGIRPGSAAYVSLETPDGGYYVGLDAPSAFHPQTLLCDAMQGLPLTPHHGAPLRLCIPSKYGFKSLKQVGTIRFTDTRPADYWAERGYDWYAGH